jgi:hypothetical protein
MIFRGDETQLQNALLAPITRRQLWAALVLGGAW